MNSKISQVPVISDPTMAGGPGAVPIYGENAEYASILGVDRRVILVAKSVADTYSGD